MVTIRVRVDPVDETMWCPGVTVEWPDGTSSSRQSDCEEYDDSPWSEVFTRYMGVGNHKFIVTLRQGKKTVKREVAVELK